MSDADATSVIREHHARITEELARRVDAALDRGARDDLDALIALLSGELLEHARAEQEHLYPLVDRLVHDHGRATATMDIDHEFIAAHVEGVVTAVERLRVTTERQPRMAARNEVRAALLRLSTLLEVHLEKEERVYLPLVDAHVPRREQQAVLDRMHGEAATSGDELDARAIPQRERHRRILEAFDALPVGSSFVLVSDHDPRPLSYQFAAQRPGAYAWEHLQRGPAWRVRITRIRG